MKYKDHIQSNQKKLTQSIEIKKILLLNFKYI